MLLFCAQLAQLRREPEAAVELWCLLPRGWSRIQQGDIAGGIADICEAMDRRRAFGLGGVWPWYLAVIADAYGDGGQIDDRFRALDEAMDWVQRNDERPYAAEVHRIRGELLLAQKEPDPVQAERCFQQALAIARDQQAKSWEPRAAMSLARLWQQNARRQDARDLLAPVYGWFTAGFDTADLIDAKALLDQL